MSLKKSLTFERLMAISAKLFHYIKLQNDQSISEYFIVIGLVFVVSMAAYQILFQMINFVLQRLFY